MFLRLNLSSSSALLNTSIRSARSVYLSPSQSLLLRSPQHLESLCSLLTCLDCLNLSWFVLNILDSLCSLFSWFWRLSKYTYFQRTSSCKLLISSLLIKFPSAHVSFAQAFEYFNFFLIAFNSVSVLLLSVHLLLLSSVLTNTKPSPAIAKERVPYI